MVSVRIVPNSDNTAFKIMNIYLVHSPEPAESINIAITTKKHLSEIELAF